MDTQGSPFFYCLAFVTTTVGAVRGDRQENHEAKPGQPVRDGPKDQGQVEALGS